MVLMGLTEQVQSHLHSAYADGGADARSPSGCSWTPVSTGGPAFLELRKGESPDKQRPMRGGARLPDDVRETPGHQGREGREETTALITCGVVALRVYQKAEDASTSGAG